MSQPKIRTAIQKHLHTLALAQGWAETLENIPNSNTAEKYVEPHLIPSATQNPSIGAQHQRRTGVMRVNIKFKNVSQGMGAIEAAAEALVAHFPRGLVLVSSGLSVHIERTPRQYPPLIDGMYNVIPVDIEYRADIISV